ncbi:MAG: hypothetical protein K2N34_01120 [Lachnospiraceae bacterium]|nr:hypothetical protein [Lachnospiraceae bacterium]
MSFYSVTAKCGHVGKGYYIPIDFSVKANSKTEAAKIVRSFPRVKHHHKDAILFCREISELEYNELRNKNRKDSYLLCHSSTEQKLFCDLEDRLVRESRKESKYDRSERVTFILKKRRIIERDYSRQCQYMVYC